MSSGGNVSGPPPPPPGPCPPPPPMMTPYQHPPVPPPFYTWGAQASAPAPTQPSLRSANPSSSSSSSVQPRPPSVSAPVRPAAVVTPARPGKDVDFTKHALDTVVAAAGAVHSQARTHNPELRETPHLRTSMAGVKRKGLAAELLAGGSSSYHVIWTQWWDTTMPQQLMTKVCS